MTLTATKEVGKLIVEESIKKMSWNERLGTLRFLKHWSQAEAAERCGTPKKNYWLWESGKSYPRRNSRKAIAIAFGVSAEEIFGKEVTN
jgi:transcriptional regulator with XRE-family HTH domain